MGVKYVIFAVLAAFLVLAMDSVCGAVDTLEIDKVRNKGVLDSRDLEIIDEFVAEGVQELVETVDFTSIAKVRTVILARTSSSRDSAAAQYAEQFSESTYKYISEGFKAIEELTPEDVRLKVMVNLLILVDGLEDLRLVNLARNKLNDESAVVRYWAVHSVTNPGIIKQLNSGGGANLKLASEIIEQLKKLVGGSCPEILALMAEFAAEVNIAQGEDLLAQIADKRISQYADWTVDYELLDATILRLLCNKMSSEPMSNPAIARRFGQLYSYAMQRYINDIRGGNFLSAIQRNQLTSVLVETEKSCIGRVLVPQSVIKKAVERGDVEGLLLEHSRLLGDETGAGRLALKLNFNYGRTSDGSERTAPLALPEPPRVESSG